MGSVSDDIRTGFVCVLRSHDISFLLLPLSFSLSLPLIVDHILTRNLKMYMDTTFRRGSPDLVLQREIISNLHMRVVPCKTHIMCSHWVCLCPVYSVSLRSDSSPPFLQVPLGTLDLERHLEWNLTSSPKRPSWRCIKRESS